MYWKRSIEERKVNRKTIYLNLVLLVKKDLLQGHMYLIPCFFMDYICFELQKSNTLPEHVDALSLKIKQTQTILSTAKNLGKLVVLIIISSFGLALKSSQ